MFLVVVPDFLNVRGHFFVRDNQTNILSPLHGKQELFQSLDELLIGLGQYVTGRIMAIYDSRYYIYSLPEKLVWQIRPSAFPGQ